MHTAEYQRRTLWAGRPQELDRQQLLERQHELLGIVVRSAAKQVPLYRDKYESAQVDFSNFQGLTDLRKLPVIDRAELQRASPEQRVAQDLRSEEMRIYRTSGSSGRPLDIFMTAEEDGLYGIFRGRTYREIGLPMDGCIASVILPHSDEPPRIPTDRRRLHLAVVDCQLPPQEIAARLAEFNPRSITGFPGTLCAVAEEGNPRDLARVRPEVTILSGEVATHPMRQLVASAFKTRVSSTYACNEVRWMGGECNETGLMHTLDDSVVVEVLNPDGTPTPPGEEGDVVVTSLHAFAQPFIRYKIGDRAVVESPAGGSQGCPCGLPYSTLKTVIGRMNDFLTLPGGQKLNAYRLTSPLLKLAPFVGRYQLVQEREDWIRWRVSPLREAEESEVATIVAHAKKVLGQDVQFDIEWNADLEQSQNGKFRIVHNKVASRFEDMS